MHALTTQAARAWIDRWDAQQQGYMPDREERFTALIDVVEATAGRPDPLVLDLGCGPGSLATRLLDRIPAATVVAIDADPLLLALGTAAATGRPGLQFTDCDLRRPGWAQRICGLDRPADAAVSTTALHWLGEPDLRPRCTPRSPTVLRPGGVLLNGDHLEEDEEQAPTLARLGRCPDRARGAAPVPRTATGELERLVDGRAGRPRAGRAGGERERRQYSEYSTDHGSESRLLSTHLAALRAAGFAEIGTLWQRGSNRLLVRRGQPRRPSRRGPAVAGPAAAAQPS